ncbi:laccase-2-like [Gossypium australe]|uniref:Laccase-2-like n=1 Tax=Gossypium australe TaxID=47621 RepID=A0A5B6V8W6_9ROSI|nr:laccase-2-like [Gossypium australe]
MNPDGSVNRYKVRLVVKGFNQQYEVDFIETFTPITRLDTIRLLLTLATQKSWRIHQMDVKSAFLNGFAIPGCEAKVYKLNNALYGLKQSLRAWYERIDNHMTKMGFERSINEPTLYVKKAGNEIFLIISLYVDDLLVIGSNNKLVIVFKDQMQDKFEMSDLGEMSDFLGLKVNQASGAIFIIQKRFAIKIL